MSHQQRKCFLAVLCFLKMLVAATDDQNVSHGNENPVCDTGAVMDQGKNTWESKATRGYTMLQITGEHLETEELCRMHQSLYVAKEPEEMISIITIKNNCQKSYTTEEYMKEFTQAIQDYTNQSEDHYTHDSLGLTIDYVKQSYAQDSDQTNIATEQYKDIEAMIDEQITKNFSKIVFDACKHYFIDSMFWFLCGYAKIVQSDNFTGTQLIAKVKQWIAEHLPFLREDHDDPEGWSEYFSYQNRRVTVFYNIYLEILKKVNCSDLIQFTGTESELYHFYCEIVAKKHMETLKKESIKLVSFFLPMLETEDMKAEYITTVCLCIKKFDKFIKFPYDWFDEEPVVEAALDKFCRQETCLNMIHEFFTSVEFIRAYMQYVTISTANTDAANCKLQSERTTKLVVQGKITVDCIPHLCCALQDNDVFANLALDQYIYVKVDDIESESRSKTFITKRKDSTVSGKTGTMKIGYCTHIKVVEKDTEANEKVSEVENCENSEGCEEEVTEKNEYLTDKDEQTAS